MSERGADQMADHQLGGVSAARRCKYKGEPLLSKITSLLSNNQQLYTQSSAWMWTPSHQPHYSVTSSTGVD